MMVSSCRGQSAAAGNGFESPMPPRSPMRFSCARDGRPHWQHGMLRFVNVH
jgi:hypothetical protein